MKKRNIPRVMIAAPNSGSGKTMITMGILSYLKNENQKVVCYKCGPDYIDPMFHKKVLGINGGNLDTYFTDDDYIRYRLGITDASCLVIEGVMGIYDGLAGTHIEGSSYDVSRAARTNIILVVDCHGSARTIISVIKGIISDDEDALIRGIILNRMPKSLFDALKTEIENVLADMGSKAVLLGFVPRIKDLNMGSRHLGLIMPDEIQDIQNQISRIEDTLRESMDFTLLKDIMSKAEDIEYNEMDSSSSGKTVTLARAYDEAFCFYYEENIKMLEDAGVRIVDFSPIHDTALPENIDGLLLGGGYPELYPEQLSSNESMKESIRKAIEGGLPSLAECGGFMYLHSAIADNSKVYRMAGVIEGECCKRDSLVRFGYIQIKTFAGTATDNSLIRELNGMKGHEFHYFDSTDNGDDATAEKPVSGRNWKCLHTGDNHVWGFPHLYYPSRPEFVNEFVKCMDNYHERKHYG